MRMTVQTSLLNVSNENPFPFEYYGVYGYQVLAQKFHSKPGFIVALVYDLQSFNVFAIRIKTKRNYNRASKYSNEKYDLPYVQKCFPNKEFWFHLCLRSY